MNSESITRRTLLRRAAVGGLSIPLLDFDPLAGLAMTPPEQPTAVSKGLPYEEFAKHDGLELAKLVKNGYVTPLELLEIAIARAKAINPTIKAIVVECYERARKEARTKLPEGPFEGVPFLVKDLGFSMKGVECTNGSRLFQGNIPQEDDTLVGRLRQAGLVIFGRSHSPELGLTGNSESALHGQTKNPWNRRHIAGGSSGGTAAAVAAGIVPMGGGTDGGGSIRIPASCCGLFGMKPTRGRVPLGPRVYEILSGLAVAGAITRSVRDSAALLDAIGGPDLGDPYGHPAKRRPFLEELKLPPKSLRIGVVDGNAASGKIHPECRKALDQAISICEGLGHRTDDVTKEFAKVVPTESLACLWYVRPRITVEQRLGQLKRELRDDDLEPVTRWCVDQADQYSALDATRVRDALHRATRRMAKLQQKYDVILLPTLAKPPLKLGVIVQSRKDVEAMFREHAAFTPFCILANQTGQPAMSVPLHWTPDKLPVGVQFYGKFGDEATLFRLAAQLEQERPWANKRPVI